MGDASRGNIPGRRLTSWDADRPARVWPFGARAHPGHLAAYFLFFLWWRCAHRGAEAGIRPTGSTSSASPTRAGSTHSSLAAGGQTRGATPVHFRGPGNGECRWGVGTSPPRGTRRGIPFQGPVGGSPRFCDAAAPLAVDRGGGGCSTAWRGEGGCRNLEATPRSSSLASATSHQMARVPIVCPVHRCNPLGSSTRQGHGSGIAHRGAHSTGPRSRQAAARATAARISRRAHADVHMPGWQVFVTKRPGGPGNGFGDWVLGVVNDRSGLEQRGAGGRWGGTAGGTRQAPGDVAPPWDEGK